MSVHTLLPANQRAGEGGSARTHARTRATDKEPPRTLQTPTSAGDPRMVACPGLPASVHLAEQQQPEGSSGPTETLRAGAPAWTGGRIRDGDDPERESARLQRARTRAAPRTPSRAEEPLRVEKLRRGCGTFRGSEVRSLHRDNQLNPDLQDSQGRARARAHQSLQL